MWIRSQDKGYLVKSPIIDIDIKKNEVYILDRTYAKEPFIGRILGVYKSKERAIEVLDEIDSKIMMNKVIEIYSNLGDLTFANRANYTYTPIYQMPEE